MPEYTSSILNNHGFTFHNWPGAGEEAANFFGLSHAVIVPPNARRVIIGGQVGIADDGKVPANITDEVDAAFEHAERALKAAGVPGWEFVYRIRTFEIPANGLLGAVKGAAAKYLGKTRPAWTGLSVAGLFSPELHIEVEVEAFIPE
ncbi:Endoribonuclease L-PSP/chorismate mutase-like protein [Aspergillus stella-maris]|uniref:Endoribonuclease L-PSP/chorismate mutase-like protein n=1 Tax=Aspergillus stella-maris TaxID=1810926 RepID=UPI003CCD15CB